MLVLVMFTRCSFPATDEEQARECSKQGVFVFATEKEPWCNGFYSVCTWFFLFRNLTHLVNTPLVTTYTVPGPFWCCNPVRVHVPEPSVSSSVGSR